jgi:hypothetical protein
MSSYRQIRRQTRRARKAGLQPIVVIDSPFPVPVGALLARWAWRYRSEIAPAGGSTTRTPARGRGCSPTPTWPHPRS